MYMWHSEGLSSRNSDLLYAAGDAIVKHGGPWMIGADFNMAPEELMQASHWLNTVGGTIKSPSTPTCKSQSGGRVIDYIVVDRRISAAISIWTDLSFPVSPRSPVVLRMNTLESRKLALFLIRPSLMPFDQPYSCS